MKAVEKALRLSQVAAELGVSRYVIQKLCQLGLIEAERTPGGHWRIPCSVVERLKAEGLPAVPALLTAEDEHESQPERADVQPIPEGLYRQASDELSESAEHLVIAEHDLQRRKLELERVTLEDQFDERARRRAEKEADQRREAAARAAQMAHDRFVERHLEWAAQLLADLKSAAIEHKLFPLGWPNRQSFAIHQSIVEALKTLSCPTPPTLVCEMVRAIVVEQLASSLAEQREEIANHQAEEQRRQLQNFNRAIELATVILRHRY